MSDWTTLAKQITEKSGVALRPARQESFSALQSMGIPDEAIAFFGEFEPTQCAEIEDVRLWPLQEILAENTDYVPGCYIVQHGYLVFATTIFGDAFCFDTKAAPGREVPIVLIAHDGYDWDAVTEEEIARLKKPIAADFRGFLQNYVDGMLDIQPNYDSVS